jgi:hypothetical protein
LTHAVERAALLVLPDDLNGQGCPFYRVKNFCPRVLGKGSFRLTGAIHVFPLSIQLPRLGRLRLKERGACGAINNNLTLDLREWTCDCGAHHDRDRNAAINLSRLAFFN